MYLHTVTSNAKNKRYQHESLFSKLHQVNRKNFSDKYRGRVTRLPQFALSQLHMRFCLRNSPDQHIHHIHLVLKYSHLDSTDMRISNISYTWSSKTCDNNILLVISPCDESPADNDSDQQRSELTCLHCNSTTSQLRATSTAAAADWSSSGAAPEHTRQHGTPALVTTHRIMINTLNTDPQYLYTPSSWKYLLQK